MPYPEMSKIQTWQSKFGEICGVDAAAEHQETEGALFAMIEADAQCKR